jgi:hypothetical protein
MADLDAWLFELSLVIGIRNSLMRKDPMALEIYKFSTHKDIKAISDFGTNVQNYYGILGFAWGLLAGAIFILLFSY